MAQARTEAQPSHTRGLMVLGDDCLHKVMTFLAVADARRGVVAVADTEEALHALAHPGLGRVERHLRT